MKINNRNIKKYKWCWVAKEVKGGWKLNLSCNNGHWNLSGAIFTSMEEIEMITQTSGKIVFIHLKNSNYPIK